MLGIFERRILYVRLFEDRIEIRDIITGKTVNRYAQKTYSNKRLLIANFQNAEAELRLAIASLNIKHQRFQRLVFVFQPFHSNIREYSEVEMRSFVDSAEHAGATEVYLYTKSNDLSDNMIMTEANHKSNLFKTW
jgi:hypothetical protein